MSTSGTLTPLVPSLHTPESPGNVCTKSLPRKAGWAHWVWPGLVCALLGAQVGLGVVAVTLATADPAWRVVPHYHEQALRWDGVMAARAASDRLGWDVSISPEEATTAGGPQPLVVTLVDGEGRPVDGATLTVELWHHARPGEVITIVCPQSAVPGRYIGDARLNRSGLWQVEIAARRHEQQFAKSLVVDWTFPSRTAKSLSATTTKLDPATQSPRLDRFLESPHSNSPATSEATSL
jgi:hypothetical protein